MDATTPRAAAYRFGGFTLDLGRGALLSDAGVERPLRPKSFALLKLLVENAGRLLDRDTIMTAVWPNVVVTDESITQCVRDIRKALGDEAQRLLKTVPRRGYLFAAEVSSAEPIMAAPRAARRLAAILAADVVGYSRLVEADEAGTLSAIHDLHQQVLDPLLTQHHGRVFKLVGDGILAEFGSAVDAVACAAALQQALAERQAGVPAECRIVLRIGVNLGDVVIERDGDLMGDGVNVAARLEGLAEPGGICVSGKVHDEVRGKLDLGFEDQGERALKNIARPVRAWRVAAATAPPRPAVAVLPVVGHNLPQPNLAFVGRVAELEALQRALVATGRGVVTQPRQAISGLGGIGKTQLALAYAYAHLGDYDLVRWLRAEEPATLAADYAGLAPVLGLDPSTPNQAALIAAVRGRLERAGRWLLVFDNATEPASLEAYLPRVGSGHILVTSRWREWEGMATALELEALPEPEAVALLLGEDADVAAQRAAAAGLAEELGRLPLALAQARAFMRARQVDVTGYRAQLAATRPKVLAWRPPHAAYPLAVAQTWQASLDHAARDCPAACELMRLLAFFAPEAVPRGLFGAQPEVLPEGLRDAFDRDTAIEALGRFSLARIEPDSLTVHRLVQAVTRDGLDEASARSHAEMAVRLVDAALPRPLLEHAHRSAVARLLPHTLAAAEAAERFEVGLAAAGAVLNDVGAYLREGAAWSEAEPLLQRALALRERALGREHPDLATSLDNLAQLYNATDRPAEAEPLYRRALAVRERALGPEHPRFAESLGCLGLFYFGTGRRAEAEPLIERAIATYERTLRPEHPELAYLLSHWAWLYHKTGRHAEAEPLYQRAIAVAEQALGPEHPRVAAFLRKLAWLYQGAGRPAEAEPLLRRALAIGEMALGPEHRDLATLLDNLAQIYQGAGRPAEAEPLLQRALALRERALGPDHPELAFSLNRLAALYRETRRPGEAEPLLQRALALREQALGPDHPRVALSLNHLSQLYHDTGRPTEAEPLFQRALAIAEQARAREHHDLLTLLRELADGCIHTGRFAEAEPLLRHLLEIRERTLGPEHPYVAGPLYQLAVVYINTGRPTEAEPLLARAIPIQERTLGPEHHFVGSSLCRLAQVYLDTDRFAEAESLYRRALEIYERALGPEHLHVSIPLNGLGRLYHETGRYTEAEPLLQRALALRERALGVEHPELANPLTHLALLYLDTGRSAEAEPLQRRALEIAEKTPPREHLHVTIALEKYAASLERVGRGEEAAALRGRASAIREHRERL
jgi:class 3 adenylate cyclase/tetratricopeptide (TPR) repeat protein